MNERDEVSGVTAGNAVLALAVDAAHEQLAGRVAAAYAIGSLAHGGFSALVSDVDLALVLDQIDDATTDEIDRVQGIVRASSEDDLAQRLSIFWADWAGVRQGIRGVGRLPEVDRLDLLDSGRLLFGTDRRAPATIPQIAVIVRQTAEFALEKFDALYKGNLKDPERLVAAGPRAATKAALFPIRFLYTLETGHVGRNDAAADWFARSSDHAELAREAMQWRSRGIEDVAAAVDVLGASLVAVYREFADRYAARLDDEGEHDLAAALRSWAQGFA